MSTRPKGASGTWATPSRLVFTFISIVLFFLILRSSMYLKYTLAFSTGVSFSPPVTSMVMRDCGSGRGASCFGWGEEEEVFRAGTCVVKKRTAATQEPVMRRREKFVI